MRVRDQCKNLEVLTNCVYQVVKLMQRVIRTSIICVRICWLPLLECCRTRTSLNCEHSSTVSFDLTLSASPQQQTVIIYCVANASQQLLQHTIHRPIPLQFEPNTWPHANLLSQRASHAALHTHTLPSGDLWAVAAWLKLLFLMDAITFEFWTS